MSEMRVYATPLYPGSFMPEEGTPMNLKVDTTPHEIAAFFGDKPFAIVVTRGLYEEWKSEGGSSKWEPTGKEVSSYRIYPGGKIYSQSDISAMGEDKFTLLENMTWNNWDYVVQSRAGNFQPFNKGDVVTYV